MAGESTEKRAVHFALSIWGKFRGNESQNATRANATGRERASERGRTNGVSSSSAAAGQRAAGAFFGVGAADALTEWLSDRSLGGRVGTGDGGGGVWRRENVCIGSMR